MSRIQNRQWI